MLLLTTIKDFWKCNSCTSPSVEKRVRESRNELKDERGGGEGGGNYSSDFDLIGISDEILFPFFSSFRADTYWAKIQKCVLLKVVLFHILAFMAAFVGQLSWP